LLGSRPLEPWGICIEGFESGVVLDLAEKARGCTLRLKHRYVAAVIDLEDVEAMTWIIFARIPPLNHMKNSIINQPLLSGLRAEESG
jgi:hypothetical protein